MREGFILRKNIEFQQNYFHGSSEEYWPTLLKWIYGRLVWYIYNILRRISFYAFFERTDYPLKWLFYITYYTAIYLTKSFGSMEDPDAHIYEVRFLDVHVRSRNYI